MNPKLFFLTTLFERPTNLGDNVPKHSKRVAVVVPAPPDGRRQLTADEQVSLRHLEKFLGHYDRFMVVPKGDYPPLPGFKKKAFSRKYFGSGQAHSWLLLSPAFYDAFLDYEYILIYHLDALVFSDQLIDWCDKGYDFVGSPMLVENDPAKGFNDVGNGGFSLRKVRSFARATRSIRLATDPDAHWQQHYATLPALQRLSRLHVRYLKRFRLFNGYKWETANYAYWEDCFWARRGTHYDPQFRIAPVSVALRFGFDFGPRYCFEQAGRILPFGCHGWFKHDREFWEPFLLRQGDGAESLR
jgi:hypothetical protein